MTNLDIYRDMEKKLHKIREKNNHNDSKEEDLLLEEMDIIWEKLSEEEKKMSSVF